MARKFLLAVICSLLVSSEGAPKFDVKLSDVFFDGGFLFFPVKQAKVQKYLDEINSQSGQNDAKLFLPSKPVLQDIIDSDEHVVMVGFGSMEAVAFDDALTNAEKQTESTLVEGLGIEIPFSTSKNGAIERITLQRKLFTSEGGHHIEANVILPPPIVADRFVREFKGNTIDIEFEKNDLQLHLIGESCVPHDKHQIEDVQEYEHELQISRSGPDFSICDQFPDLQVDLCTVYRQYNSILKQEGANVCLYWVPTDDVRNCKSTVHVSSMSEAMRELLLLDEGHYTIEAEYQSGTFDIRLVFPCIE